MKKQILRAIAGIGIVIVILGGIKFIKISSAIAQHESMQPPPDGVTTIVAAEEVWPETIEAVGSISAVQGVILKSETSGKITKILFDSGTTVKEGDLLVEIDPSVEEANLKSAIAMHDKALRNYERMKKLMSDSAASKAENENAEAAYRAAEAEVSSLQAQIAKKHIVAPFSGKLGVKRVNLGQFVEGGTEIIPLYDLSAMHVDFSVPQRQVSKIQEGLEVEVRIEGVNDKTFSGKITSFDPQIDVITRNARVRGTLKNEGEVLRPGMFARATVTLPNIQKYIAIPVSSVSYAPYGDTVFIIEDMKDPKGNSYRGVKSVGVSLGETRGNQVAVLKGLAPGMEVVSSGAFKLRPGSAVVVNNALAPANDPKPQPGDA